MQVALGENPIQLHLLIKLPMTCNDVATMEDTYTKELRDKYGELIGGAI